MKPWAVGGADSEAQFPKEIDGEWGLNLPFLYLFSILGYFLVPSSFRAERPLWQLHFAILFPLECLLFIYNFFNAKGKSTWAFY